MEPAPQTFGAYLKSYFKNLWQTVKHPLAFLPTILITGVWILLGILQTRYGESKLFAVCNFLTFAQGGLFGGIAGAIGGIVGKILVATLVNALLLPIFVRGTKPMAKFGSGFKSFFRSFAFDSARALSAFLFGMAVALALYSVLNITQRWQEGLVGVVAAVLLIRTIGQKGGLLFSMLYSFAKGLSRDKLPSQAGITRFLSGMSLGFVAGTGLNAFGFKWAILVALGALALSFLFFLFGKRKSAAVTAACIACLVFVPLSAGSPAPQTQEDYQRAARVYAKELTPLSQEIQRLNKEVQAAAERGDEEEGTKLSKQLQDAMDRYQAALTARARQLSGQGSDEEDTNPFTHLADDDGFSLPDDTPTVSDDNIPRGHVNTDILHVGEDSRKANKDRSDDEEEDEESGSGRNGGRRGGGNNGGESAWDDVYDQVRDVATNGLADEDSRLDDEQDITSLDVVAGATAAAAAGGAAAGGAAGGAGGGAGAPDFPDSEGLDWDMDRRKKEDEEDENYYYSGEDEETEGGDGEDEEYDDEAGYDGEQEGEEEEEADAEEADAEEDAEADDTADDYESDDTDDSDYDSDSYDSSDADDAGSDDADDAGSDDAESDYGGYDSGEDSDGTGDAEADTEAGNADDSDAAEDAEEAEDAGGDEAEDEAAEDDGEKEQEVEKKPEEEKKPEAKEKSEEEKRREEEEAKEKARWDQIAKELKEQEENMRKIANKFGVPLKDENGEDRPEWQIYHDTQMAILRDKNNGLFQDALDTQQICSEVELECSERIAECELVDKVSDGTVNILAEVVPGGDKVKDARDLLKAPLVGASEAYAEGRSVTRGIAGGLTEGIATVAQNHLDDVLDGAAKDVVDITFEGGKKLVNAEISGKYDEDPDGTIEDVQKALAKKTLDVGIGRLLGKTSMGEAAQNISKEIILKGHDEMTIGDGDDAKTLSDAIAGKIRDFSTEATAWGMYATGTDDPVTYQHNAIWLQLKPRDQ